VSEVEFDQVLEVIRDAQSSYNKLVIIAGPRGSGKTTLLERVARAMNNTPINLSLLISERMLSLTRRQRKLKALELARELIDEQTNARCCLDNTELLFDSGLSLNPLHFFQEISRNRLIVATWNGVSKDGTLSFGYAGHPDFFQERVTSAQVISLTNAKL
jgi:DNA polymerase III delta prime subunit